MTDERGAIRTSYCNARGGFIRAQRGRQTLEIERMIDVIAVASELYSLQMNKFI